MNKYKELETKVFMWLMAKQKQDPHFNFSIRQKASKGAELNYFIGTEKSNYLATTFWIIPIGFPGSASDLINLMFILTDNGYSYRLQFNQTRKPIGTQNELALEFIIQVKQDLKSKNYTLFENDSSNKMEFFYILPKEKDYKEIDDLLKDAERLLDNIVPFINDEIAGFRKKRPNFKAHQIDSKEFDRMLERFEKRRKKYESEDTHTAEEDKHKMFQIEKCNPLNLILFGPPGTGKTFNTINKAIAIANPDFNVNQDRSIIKTEFERLVKDHQIALTTFHQSMSYEDFVEGIKPIISENQNVIYDIEPGIFRNIASIARDNWMNVTIGSIEQLPFEEAFKLFQDEWLENNDLKISLKRKGNEYTILGFSNTSIKFKKASGGTGHTLSISSLRDYYYKKRDVRPTGVGIYYPGILERLRLYRSDKTNGNNLLNYVLIIDEINRGNVSAILGELITLIEDDKRLGNPEAIEVILPYSKEAFGVPPNLYILGTMNTADRSVEAIDNALRRRFCFEEICSQPEQVSPHMLLQYLWMKHRSLDWNNPKWKNIENRFLDLHGGKILDRKSYEGLESKMVVPNFNLELKEIISFNGINLCTLLSVINKRIEQILDKDHHIGHSYFMSVIGWQELFLVFKNNIIPLLQEYFYGDFGKIGLILGKGFIRKKVWNVNNDSFAAFDYENASDYEDKTVYELINFQLSEGLDDFKKAINSLTTSHA